MNFVPTGRFLPLFSFALGACVVGILWFIDNHFLENPHITTGPPDFIFSVSSESDATYFDVATNGHVGVGTLDPKTALDVTGSIRAQTSSDEACTSETEGAFTYNLSEKHFLGCDGTRWLVLDK